MTNAQAHVGAAHLVGAADAGAGARRDRLLRRATAAALAGTREPHGLGAPTAAYAVCVGATRAAAVGAPRLIPTAAAWPRRWTSSTSTTRAGRSSRLIGRGGGRCCRAARHRRLSNSRPRPRYPCSYPTPSCAPGVLRRCALTPPLTRRCEPRRRLRVSAKLRRPGKRCPHAHPPLALRFRNALI